MSSSVASTTLSPYQQKLLNPRWQRKRLEVLQRDDFTCARCCGSESTLHVHHKTYERGRDPWEYPLSNFMTLCENCHEDDHASRPAAERRILQALRAVGMDAVLLNCLSEGLESWAASIAPDHPAGIDALSAELFAVALKAVLADPAARHSITESHAKNRRWALEAQREATAVEAFWNKEDGE